MLVLSANYNTCLYSCYLENSPSSNDLIYVAVSCLVIIEDNVLFYMFMLMPLLSVEVLLCTRLHNDKHTLGIELRSLLSVMVLSM